MAPSQHPRARNGLALLLPTLLVALACSTPTDAGVFETPGGDPEHHRLRYLDGQVSPNDSCMVKTGNKLNPAVRPLYVNGRPHGFC